VHAAEQADLAAKVNQAVVNERRGHVGRAPRPTPLFGRAASLYRPLGLGLDANDGAVLGSRNDNEVGRGDRSRDEAKSRIISVLGVEIAQAPNLAAVGEAMSGA